MIEIIATIFNLFLIAWICVFIIDCSGIVEEMEMRMKKICPLYRIGKPFSCSLCMTWWISLAYLLAVGHFTLPYVAITAFWAILTGELGALIRYIQSYIARAIIRADERDEYRTSTQYQPKPERRKIGY